MQQESVTVTFENEKIISHIWSMRLKVFFIIKYQKYWTLSICLSMGLFIFSFFSGGTFFFSFKYYLDPIDWGMRVFRDCWHQKLSNLVWLTCMYSSLMSMWLLVILLMMLLMIGHGMVAVVPDNNSAILIVVTWGIITIVFNQLERGRHYIPIMHGSLTGSWICFHHF